MRSAGTATRRSLAGLDAHRRACAQTAVARSLSRRPTPPITLAPVGFFKRTVDSVNTHYDVASTLAVALDPANRRVRKLEARGTPANGMITGIRFTLNDTTTRKEFAVSVPQDGGRVLRFGIRSQPTEAHRLRLGVPVVAKVDGDRGVLDWEAMRAAWDLGDQFLSQESIRRPPDDGIVDTALDARVQRRLKRWRPAQGTITSLERRTVMGMPSLDWNIELRLADGGTAVSKSDEVPSYAQWYAAPGTVVAAVVDPNDTSQASIDWPAVALAQLAEVAFDDDPPLGSIAAELESARGAGAVSALSTAVPPPPPAPDAPVRLDTTMQSWVDAFRAGNMSEKDFEGALADWGEAGMCNAAQIAAARAAASA